LIEFLTKTHEFFPDTARSVNTIYTSDDCVISEWTLTATHSEPFLGGLMREVPIRVRGISVVRSKNGKISQWSDYYDRLTSRRHRLAAWFTDWIEL
jgi:ketosteroid isomerase-like protein